MQEEEVQAVKELWRGVIAEKYETIIETIYSGADHVDINTVIHFQDGSKQRVVTTLAIETLARALPAGWKVVVKENPAQRFAKRELGFYEHLAGIPAVHLVSKQENTFDLIERCDAVATITGTAGWEALFRGKPSIAFGRAFYRGGPGVISVDDPIELARELHSVELPRSV